MSGFWRWILVPLWAVVVLSSPEAAGTVPARILQGEGDAPLAEFLEPGNDDKDAPPPPQGLAPYWSRETRLHEDSLAGTLAGRESDPSYAFGQEYNHQIPPRAADGDRPIVRVGINVYKIKEIDIASARMKLNVWLRMSWVDPRLAWNSSRPEYYNLQQTTYDADTSPEITNIWVPDLELINQDDGVVDSFEYKQAQVFEDGSVFWSRVGSLNALCAFSGLRKHPFDENECTVDFSGWSRSGLFANYDFLDPPLTWGGTGTAATTYQEYALVPEKARANNMVYYYPCCPDEPWPTLTYTFVFRRITTALYLRTLFVPVMVLTILASLVFWWDVRCGERLGYGITVLLAITAVEIIAAEALPTCPEWLWIEAFTTGSYAFSVGCLLESGLVTYIYFKQRQEDLNEWLRVGNAKKEADAGGTPRLAHRPTPNHHHHHKSGRPSLDRSNRSEEEGSFYNDSTSFYRPSTSSSSRMVGFQDYKLGGNNDNNNNEDKGDASERSEAAKSSKSSLENDKDATTHTGKTWGLSEHLQPGEGLAGANGEAGVDDDEEDDEEDGFGNFDTEAPLPRHPRKRAQRRSTTGLTSFLTSVILRPQMGHKASDYEKFDKWSADRNMEIEQFTLVRRIDRIAFRIFASVYSLFTIAMFATLPLWTDEYSVNK